MKIITGNEGVKIQYTHKLLKKQVIRKNKGKTLNTFYMARLPLSLYEYMDIHDRNLFIYEHEDNVCLTSRRPVVEHRTIKLQKNLTFSLPADYFNFENKSEVIITINLVRYDIPSRTMGLINIKVM